LEKQPNPEKKSTLSVVIHSFFVVPFIIAIFSVIIFLVARILTAEPNTARDYLEDVKIGGTTKRWQGAFELSKILSNPKMVPKDERFVTEMISAFNYAEYDRDDRIRQYLAIAMGATGDIRYVETLLNALDESKPEIAKASAYALGNLGDRRAVEKIIGLLDSADPQIRLQAVIALGKISDPSSISQLTKMLKDLEPNVRWDAAIALAKQKNASGKRILLDLLDRKYLDSFPNIDEIEQVQVLMVVINIVPMIQDADFRVSLEKLLESDSNLKVREAARNALLNF
jgi:HEAT repeat protein|tara:strand:+ start:97 stop:951 length:855 start_codon:yes stop_codon:yes gene_type:complete